MLVLHTTLFQEMPKEAEKAIEEELEKLSSLEKNSPEFNGTKSYLDWLTQLPWGHASVDNFDLKRAKEGLDEVSVASDAGGGRGGAFEGWAWVAQHFGDLHTTLYLCCCALVKSRERQLSLGGKHRRWVCLRAATLPPKR